MAQRIDKQIGPLAAVESELHLLQVGSEMFCAHLVPRSHNAALQERECGFDSVGMDVTFYVNLELVPNRLVATVFPQIGRCAPVGVEVIGKQDFNVLADVLADESLERATFYIVNVKQAKVTAALPNPDNYFFILILVLPSAPDVSAPDKRFVHFYFAGQHWSVCLHHRVPNAMAEVPCGFIADSQRALNLACRNALLGLAKQECGKEPRFQRQVRIIEDGSGGDGKLVVAVFAVKQLLVGFKLHDGHLASRAFGTRRPAESHKQFPTLFICREHGVYVN